MSGQVEEQKLGTVRRGSRQGQFRFVAHSRAVSLVELLSVQQDAAARYLHPAVSSPREGLFQSLAVPELGRINPRILMNHRGGLRGGWVGTRQKLELAVFLGRREGNLVISRLHILHCR